MAPECLNPELGTLTEKVRGARGSQLCLRRAVLRVGAAQASVAGAAGPTRPVRRRCGRQRPRAHSLAWHALVNCCGSSMLPRCAAQVDIFSLAIVMWELVTRRRPWEGIKVGRGFCWLSVLLTHVRTRTQPCARGSRVRRHTLVCNTCMRTRACTRVCAHLHASARGPPGARRQRAPFRPAPPQHTQMYEFLQRVMVDGARLPLPNDDNVCPLAWRRLISRCWSADPLQRPCASEVVTVLARLYKYWH